MRFAKLRIERRVIPAFLCFLSSVFLFGCEPVFLVTPVSDSEMLPHPKFKVVDPDHPDQPPGFHTIKLLASDGRLLWHLRADPFGKQTTISVFSYGVPLRGFKEVVAPQPLQPGGAYTLFVFGTPTGSLRFTVDAAGRIRAV